MNVNFRQAEEGDEDFELRTAEVSLDSQAIHFSLQAQFMEDLLSKICRKLLFRALLKMYIDSCLKISYCSLIRLNAFRSLVSLCSLICRNHLVNGTRDITLKKWHQFRPAQSDSVFTNQIA